MRKNNSLAATIACSLVLTCSIATSAAAQVVPPEEIRDPDLRTLQQGSMSQLKIVALNIATTRFDFPFYCSRKLDIDRKIQQRSDQHSIRFEHFEGAVVVAISGNYYAAYSAERFSEGQRARQTFLRVVLPIIKDSVPALERTPQVQGYAIEVSHHVISRSLGLPVEHAENLMIYLPRSAAIKLVNAKNEQAQQAALLESRIFLNANPISIWLDDDIHPNASPTRSDPNARPEPATLMPISTAPSRLSLTTTTDTAPPLQQTITAETTPPTIPTPAQPLPQPLPQTATLVAAAIPPPTPAAAPAAAPAPATAPLPTPAATAVHSATPQALAALQSSIQGTSNHMLKDLEPAAHFTGYAPPAFIAFRNQAYLELSLNTPLAEPGNTSRYKLAALAFDDHISPLIRRVLTYFPGEQQFDGISFSTTIHTPAKPGTPTPKPLSVEFFLPLTALHCYEAYDCTGQQLLDAGIVLVNGERVGINLQLAEATSRP